MPIDFGPGDLYVQLYSSSPAPKRDYHGLTITAKYVILNSWDISHGPHVFPKRLRTPLEELEEDEQLQKDIKHLFGSHVLDYALQLVNNNKSLQTLPNKIFLKILRLLAANDILRLGQTSKIFFEICNANLVWKIIFRKRLKKGLTNQELLQSEKQSWRYLLKKKLLEKSQQMKNIEKKIFRFPKPSQDVLDSIARYSKPIIHKKRTPPKNQVPKDKLDIDIDFKIAEYEKSKSKIMSPLQKQTHSVPSIPRNLPASILSESSKKSESPFLQIQQKWTSNSQNASSATLTQKKPTRSASAVQIKTESPKNVTKKFSSPNLPQKVSTAKTTIEKPKLKTVNEKMDFKVTKSGSDAKKSNSSQINVKSKM